VHQTAPGQVLEMTDNRFRLCCQRHRKRGSQHHVTAFVIALSGGNPPTELEPFKADSKRSGKGLGGLKKSGIITRPTPQACWHHRNRYITGQMIENLFELPPAIEQERRMRAIAKPHRGDGKRFVVGMKS